MEEWGKAEGRLNDERREWVKDEWGGEWMKLNDGLIVADK